ncbi:MAG TPA: 30S ribosomal protein S20 [Acidobacteriota bacterium]|nr:30S ribosomal protein S20 [Acidobacteriota bacterium]HNT17416.1 30S ribosomal protein S20 [Acidobacteriota bacterium]HPA26227.1 30S ribosomal protein S20 [Acidobacteriota bacterium]HQO18786.1 30S ribosomal protein S20 [Acidobacteriota bacterium]HQQ46675.1 30S ribosomal protein S20 [Acidobacteriota bacterium]
MANHKSAEKRARQSEKRNARNRLAKGQMKGVTKKFRSLLEENKVEEARKILPEVYSVIDRTEKKGVIHAKTAARCKSRLAKKIKG